MTSEILLIPVALSKSKLGLASLIHIAHPLQPIFTLSLNPQTNPRICDLTRHQPSIYGTKSHYEDAVKSPRQKYSLRARAPKSWNWLPNVLSFVCRRLSPMNLEHLFSFFCLGDHEERFMRLGILTGDQCLKKRVKENTKVLTRWEVLQTKYKVPQDSNKKSLLPQLHSTMQKVSRLPGKKK